MFYFKFEEENLRVEDLRWGSIGWGNPGRNMDLQPRAWEVVIGAPLLEKPFWRKVKEQGGIRRAGVWNSSYRPGVDNDWPLALLVSWEQLHGSGKMTHVEQSPQTGPWNGPECLWVHDWLGFSVTSWARTRVSGVESWVFYLLVRTEPYCQSKLYANCQSKLTIVVITEM